MESFQLVIPMGNRREDEWWMILSSFLTSIVIPYAHMSVLSFGLISESGSSCSSSGAIHRSDPAFPLDEFGIIVSVISRAISRPANKGRPFGETWMLY